MKKNSEYKLSGLRCLDAAKRTISTSVRVMITVPIFNEELMIIPFLESIMAQEDRKGHLLQRDFFHVILVDNGSNDHTVKKINDFIKLHPEMSIELTSENSKGVTFARKQGLDLVYKRYIDNQDRFDKPLVVASLDVDNCLNRNWLYGIITKLDEDDEADILTGKMLFDISDFKGKQNYMRLFSCLGEFGDKLSSCYGPKTTNNYA